MDCWSGGEDAYRLVAARKMLTTVGTGLFVRLHATSGDYGESNTKSVIDTIIANYLQSPLFGASFVVIGADFNWTATDYESDLLDNRGNGYFVTLPQGARIAVDRPPIGEALRIKVSDHCAVTAWLQLTA